MYPSALVSRPLSIDYHANDTEMLLHLDNMMHGAPRPQNVLTDVDPNAVAPWNLPPNMLYFIQLDHDISLNGEKGIKATEGGYWSSRTWTQSPTMGRVTTKEFYRGKAPRGEKSDWVMKEYTIDKFLGSSSLCKVFKHNGGNHSEERQQAVADDADGDFVEAMLIGMLEDEENISGFQSLSNMSQAVADDADRGFVEAMLLGMLEDEEKDEENIGGFQSLPNMSQAVADDADGGFVEAMLLGMLEDEEKDEENISGFQSLSNISQVRDRNKRGPPVFSASHLQNLRPPNYVWVPDEDDFLEERDLVGSASSSSLSSGNTRVSSMTLNDDYFDPEALMRGLTPSTQDTTNRQNVDCCRTAGSSSRGSHQVHIQPPPSGSLRGSGSSSNKYENPLVMKTMVSASLPSIHIGALNHTHPPAASVEKLPNKNIVGRITKLVKKCFCFM